MRASLTPTTWRVGRAGLARGPRKLNTVGTPSSRRGGGGGRGGGGVGGGAGKLEPRRPPQLGGGRGGVRGGGGVGGRKTDPHPRLGQTALDAGGAEIDDDAQGFEHVGRARSRRGRPVPVLAHRHA